MFKPINSRIEEAWFNLSDKYTRLYILRTLINIYNDTDHPGIVCLLYTSDAADEL